MNKLFENIILLVAFFGVILIILYATGILAAVLLAIWVIFDLSSNWWIILLWFVACSICGILSAEWEKKRSK